MILDGRWITKTALRPEKTSSHRWVCVIPFILYRWDVHYEYHWWEDTGRYFFPLRIREKGHWRSRVVQSPDDIAMGTTFKVLDTVVDKYDLCKAWKESLRK